MLEHLKMLKTCLGPSRSSMDASRASSSCSGLDRREGGKVEAALNATQTIERLRGFGWWRKAVKCLSWGPRAEY